MPNPFPGDMKIGTAEPYAWPGGYPIGYLCADGEYICAACVNDPSNPVGTSEDTAEDWRIVGFQIFEGTAEDYGAINCAHCEKVLVEDETTNPESDPATWTIPGDGIADGGSNYEDEPATNDEPHKGHHSRFGGLWYCDTCDSPYCDLA